jgi:hypothetical protein
VRDNTIQKFTVVVRVSYRGSGLVLRSLASFLLNRTFAAEFKQEAVALAKKIKAHAGSEAL